MNFLPDSQTIHFLIKLSDEKEIIFWNADYCGIICL